MSPQRRSAYIKQLGDFYLRPTETMHKNHSCSLRFSQILKRR